MTKVRRTQSKRQEQNSRGNGKESKKPLILALISLILWSVTCFYQVRQGERGPLSGKPDPTFHIGPRIGITNGIGSAILFIKMSITNFGTAPLHIAPMEMFVSKKGTKECKLLTLVSQSSHPLSSWLVMDYFTLMENNSWANFVFFGEERNSAQDLDEVDLLLNLMESQQKKLLSDPNLTSTRTKNLYKVDESIFRDISDRLEQNIAWLDQGEYQVLLSVKDAKSDSKTYFQAAYSFTIKRETIKKLCAIQAKAYLYQGVDTAPLTQHLIYRRLSILKTSELDRLIALEKKHKQSLNN